MSLEFRKNDAKSKSRDIYSLIHTHTVDSLSCTEIHKINYYLSEVLKIIEGGK